MVSCYQGDRTLDGRPRNSCPKAEYAFEPLIHTRVRDAGNRMRSAFAAGGRDFDHASSLAYYRVFRWISGVDPSTLVLGPDFGAIIYTYAERGFKTILSTKPREIPDPDPVGGGGADCEGGGFDSDGGGATSRLRRLHQNADALIASLEQSPVQGVELAVVKRWIDERFDDRAPTVRGLVTAMDVTFSRAQASIARSRGAAIERCEEMGLGLGELRDLVLLLTPGIGRPRGDA